MRRISRVEMDHLVREITEHATTLNLLPLKAQVHWVPGNQTAGIAPQTTVTVPRPDGTTEVIHPSFLPEFGYRDSTRDAFKALGATNKALSVLAARER